MLLPSRMLLGLLVWTVMRFCLLGLMEFLVTLRLREASLLFLIPFVLHQVPPIHLLTIVTACGLQECSLAYPLWFILLGMVAALVRLALKVMLFCLCRLMKVLLLARPRGVLPLLMNLIVQYPTPQVRLHTISIQTPPAFPR